MAIFQIFGHNPTNHEINPFMPKTDKNTDDDSNI